MNKQEALDYLNVASNAGATEISRAFSEKFNHFQYLHTHAPNDLLRNIHRQNLDQLEKVRQTLGISIGAGISVEAVNTPVAVKEKSSSGHESSPTSGALEPVGWLIRHTENKSHSYHPLWPGETAIGRTAVVNRRSICIEDDPFVSRYHAVVVVTPRKSGFSIEIADDGRFNQGSASKNGVFINAGEKRLGSGDIRILQDGDTIQIGNTKFVLRINTESKTISSLVKEVEKTQFVKTVVIDL